MNRFSNILVVANSGSDDTAALRRAITLAKNNQAKLTVCSVVEGIPSGMQGAITAVTPTEIRDILVSEEQSRLQQFTESVARDQLDVETKVLVGKIFVEIIRMILSDGYDLVVKSADNVTNLRNVMFGSTDMHLMRKCPCPVWIMKPSPEIHHRRILAAVDQDPELDVKNVLNQQILELSMSLALAEFNELHIVHAWSMPGEDLYRSARSGLSDAEVDAIVSKEESVRRRWLEDLVNTHAAADKEALEFLSPTIHMIEGDAKQVVAEKARDLDIDLIVMGTVARTGVSGLFMGNTAESILNQIDCSVLAIKPPGFVSPISH